MQNMVTGPAPEKAYKKGRILVLGLGNILLKDEGIGVHAAEKLQEFALTEDVEVIDGGTAGMEVLLSQGGGYKLVVIDAMRGGERPGTIYKARFGPGDIDKLEQIFGCEPKLGLHQAGLIDSLAAAARLNCGPDEIVIIGVEPCEVGWGLTPTEELKNRVEEIVNTVLEEIGHAVYEE